MATEKDSDKLSSVEKEITMEEKLPHCISCKRQ